MSRKTGKSSSKMRSNRNHRGASADKDSTSGYWLHGFHTVREALKNPNRTIQNLKLTKNMAMRLETEIASRHLPVDLVAPADLDELTGHGAVHQGVAALVSPLPDIDIDDLPTTGTVIVLDQVSDPHNVGAIARTAAAFGIPALISTDRHSPQVTGILAKSASGALEHVALIRETNLARAMARLQDKGYMLVGMDSEAEHSFDTLPKSDAVALVLGAEGKGLRQLTRKNCDFLVRLDLPGPIKSLNVSNAAALAMYALNARK